MLENENAKMIAVLFGKLDKLTERYNEHDKSAGNQLSKLENEIKHLTDELHQLREEQRIQQNQLHVNAETNSEERYKQREHLTKLISDAQVDLSGQISKAEVSAVKSANSYTNRGVSIAVGVVVFIFGMIETIWYVKDLLRPGGH